VLREVTKRFATTLAVDRVSLDIGDGELFTLLGPSGCGKTTLLRLVAGFYPVDAGEIHFGHRRVDGLAPYERNIGMVFQNYALWPHMTVRGNITYGLRLRKLDAAEVERRLATELAKVNLTGLEERYPGELSGGQQQRVALARALVLNPDILLLDEPLSNLDAKLRLELRDDIRDLQRSLGITTIYVTHDQEEALVISDRICVMQAGRVHQVASPREVYSRPATLFVGSFVGAMNVLADRAVAGDGAVTIGATTLPLPALAGRAQATLGVRPEDLEVGATALAGAFNVDATIEKVTYAGSEAFYRLACADGSRLHAHVYRPDPDALFAVGARVVAALPVARLHAFDSGSGERIAL
jgi:ABC-type Fe3+/spermidine/putrescine transport system ATPase subunit